MTPFGLRVRGLRAKRGITLKKMAEDLGVSSAYLSALEHGNRGLPGAGMVQQICAYFDLTWDETEEMRRIIALSDPRAVIDTAGLTPKATELANLLARHIGDLDEDAIDWVIAEVRGYLSPLRGPTH